MSLRPEVLVAILLCMAVTVLPRVLPLLFSHRLKVPALVVAWLRLMAPAILASLLAPLLFFADDGQLKDTGSLLAIGLACAITIAIVRLVGRSLVFGFVGGVAAYALIINVGLF